jgi:hypothetical protein
MSGILQRFKGLVSWVSTTWTILGWLGWKPIATSVALAVVGVVAGVTQKVPSSIVVMAFLLISHSWALPAAPSDLTPATVPHIAQG